MRLTFLAAAVAVALPSLRWAVPLVDGGSGRNATFGTPTPFVLSGTSVVAVLAVDSNATTWLFVVRALDGSLQWRIPMPYIQAQSGWVAAGTLGASGDAALFAGTDAGIMAVRADTGAVVWQHFAPQGPQPVPAHPTFAGDAVFYTFENGGDSSPLTVLDAATGAIRWQTVDLAFSLIWPVAQRDAVVYMSFVAPSSVAVVCRAFSGAVAWSRAGLATTGLNNNPNLDVGAVGEVLLYSKPTNFMRNLTLLNRDTGDAMWDVPMAGDIVDYDTYAYGGLYYRLTYVNETTFALQALAVSGESQFRVFAALNDTDAILLVGGPAAFIFAPNANTVTAFDRLTGANLWRYGGATVPNDGQVLALSATVNLLVFGDGLGIFRGLQI